MQYFGSIPQFEFTESYYVSGEKQHPKTENTCHPG